MRVVRLLNLILITLALVFNGLVFIFLASLVKQWRVTVIKDLL